VVDRGLIVVDTCSLYNLQAGIRRDLYEDGDPVGKPVRRYLDLLPLLGERGFRVVVPEMVSVEMGGTLIGAPNINDLFSGSRRNQETTDGASAAKPQPSRVRPSKSANDNGEEPHKARKYASENIPLSDEAGLIRLEIMDIFKEKGETAPNITAIGRYFRAKYAHGAVAVIYPLLNADYIIKSEHSVKKALADKTRDMLSEYLAAHGKADMIPLFHEKFAELRKATHHRGRESLSELSV
jgi:hypothetical protein